MSDLTAKVEEIERLLAAATAGPWFVDKSPNCKPGFVSAGSRALARCYRASDLKGTPPANNAALIAALHTIAPALIADWKRLKAERDVMAEALAEARKPNMFWADGECPNQEPAGFLQEEWEQHFPDEWEESYGDEGALPFTCARSLPVTWVSYRRTESGFVTTHHKTEAEARKALESSK